MGITFKKSSLTSNFLSTSISVQEKVGFEYCTHGNFYALNTGARLYPFSNVRYFMTAPLRSGKIPESGKVSRK